MTGVSALDADLHLDATTLDGFLAAQRAAGLMHGSRPICRVLSPLVVTHAVYRRVRRAAELVLSAMERLLVRVAVDDRLAAVLGIDASERALHAIDPGYPRALVIARLDMVFLEPSGDDEDAFVFLELNADSPAGIIDQAAVEATLYALAPVRTALSGYRAVPLAPVRALLDALLETHRAWGGSGLPRIAIVDWGDVDTMAEQEVLQRAFVAQGTPTVLTTPEALRWDGTRLSVDGTPIDLVYRRLIARELRARLDDAHPLLQAVRAGAVCLANPFRSTVANKKSAFAVLSDPAWAHLFTPDERAVIEAHIPWTRVLGRGGDDATLCADATARRNDLVLKPDEDYGGHGVVLGWTVGDDEWRTALARGVADGAVLQRRVPVRRLRFPTFDDGGVRRQDLGFDLNPFLFRGRVEGGMVRVSEGPLSNVSAGGGVTGLLVVDDADEAGAHV
ncbi:MAG TPA: hypothetical protein VGR62_15740 [Candidatus Binatia bacterium]|jgi:uncharacterized circularly permuted ATP-grasp superfamily protein|nr:hypothetical protein [Candidatus Binatia bacterium]